MENPLFVDGLIGNSAPVLTLYEELVASGVCVECYPGGVSPHTGNGRMFATADWHSNEGIWRIYFASNARMHQVYHELLHVRFKSLDGAPVMAAYDSEERLRRNVEELNNDFDHANVVPLEIMEYPEAATYWEADFTRVLGELPSPSSDPFNMIQRKLGLLRGWLVLPNAMPMASVTQAFQRELNNGGWLEAANTMAGRVRDSGANKAQAVQAFRDALGVDFPPAENVKFSR